MVDWRRQQKNGMGGSVCVCVCGGGGGNLLSFYSGIQLLKILYLIPTEHRFFYDEKVFNQGICVRYNT